jgi:hypothetical protein
VERLSAHWSGGSVTADSFAGAQAARRGPEHCFHSGVGTRSWAQVQAANSSSRWRLPTSSGDERIRGRCPRRRCGAWSPHRGGEPETDQTRRRLVRGCPASRGNRAAGAGGARAVVAVAPGVCRGRRPHQVIGGAILLATCGEAGNVLRRAVPPGRTVGRVRRVGPGGGSNQTGPRGTHVAANPRRRGQVGLSVVVGRAGDGGSPNSLTG